MPRLIYSLCSFTAGTTPSPDLPVDRLGFLLRDIAIVGQPNSACHPEAETPEDRQSIIDAMLRVVIDNDSGTEESSVRASKGIPKKRKASAVFKDKELRLFPNISQESCYQLERELQSYIDQFNDSQLMERRWDYLRGLQEWRAFNMNYAAIREDLHILQGMNLRSIDIANIFFFASFIMTRGLPYKGRSCVEPPTLPLTGFVTISEMQLPLLERFEKFYYQILRQSSQDHTSELSVRLARYIEEGQIDRVANAFNLAKLAEVQWFDIANFFNKAFIALKQKCQSS